MLEDGDHESALRQLIETEVPEGRSNLESSSRNLEEVAAYCELTYARSDNKKATFDATKGYVVQSLASVAYHVNILAAALLQTLDLQGEKLSRISEQVHNVEAVIKIRKEKAARREIGSLTADKCIQKQPKIVARQQPEAVQRYERYPIDYTLLDGIGHGVRQVETPINRNLISRTASSVSGASVGGAHYPIFPNYEQLLPRASFTSTLSRSSGTHYRTPQVASTPTIDPQRLSSLTQMSNYGRIQSSSGYGTLSHVDTTVPLPPPQLAPVAQYRLSDSSIDRLPPPPGSLLIDEDPLPPPPEQMTMIPSNYSTATLKPQSNNYDLNVSGGDARPLERPYSSVEWIPKIYMEKGYFLAIVLYDYDAEKPDELTLRENNVVYVLRKNDDGWYEGVLNGCTGLFPGNYVQKV
uniref:SH3 domain-containing protein n=1 Tax=Syphacia muris TaxID=451379 RepID=A0A0N5AAQ3_9BILA